MIKILHVTECLGGVETYLNLLAAHIDPEKFEFHFVLPRQCTVSEIANERKFGATYLSISHNLQPIKDFICTLKLRSLINDLKPQIVHLHSSKAGLLGRLACIGLKTRVIYTPHAYYYLGLKGIRKKLFLFAEKFLHLFTDAVLATSPSEKRRAVKDIGFDTDRAHAILNAIGLKELHSVRKTHQHKERKNRVIMVARISNQKNIPMYLDVVRLFKDNNDIEFLLVGSGHYSGDQLALDKLLRERGLEDGRDIITIPWMARQDLLELMTTATIAVLTSHYESFGYVLAEANALAIPVVGTDVDGIRDVIINGYNGFIVHTDDATAMANHIKMLAEDPILWKDISTNAIARATSNFDMALQVKEFESFYMSQLCT